MSTTTTSVASPERTLTPRVGTGIARPAPRNPLARAAITLRGIADGLRDGLPVMADRRSQVRWATDVLRYRLLRLTDVGLDAERTIRLRTGETITYRLNRGDILAVQETFLNDAYDFGDAVAHADTIVDLGANIGLTGVWLARRLGARIVVGVEANPANAALARRNYAQNDVTGVVLDAAIADRDGTAFFSDEKVATTGQLAASGRPVRTVSFDTVLAALGADRADLVKLDIEGGEGALLAGDPEWTARVGAIVAELHPDDADIPAVVATLRRAGFTYEAVDTHPAYGPHGTEYMAVFTRTDG